MYFNFISNNLILFYCIIWVSLLCCKFGFATNYALFGGFGPKILMVYKKLHCACLPLYFKHYTQSYFHVIFKALALWANAFYKLKCPSVRLFVCPSVRLFTLEVPFKRLFAHTSWSRMSNIFRGSESLGKSNGKKWSHIRTFLFENCQKSLRKKKRFFFLLILPYKTWWKPCFSMD